MSAVKSFLWRANKEKSLHLDSVCMLQMFFALNLEWPS
jgi:hypothetical protein